MLSLVSVLFLYCLENGMFDLWLLMRSLKFTKKPASRFSKMVRDLVAERPQASQIAH